MLGGPSGLRTILRGRLQSCLASLLELDILLENSVVGDLPVGTTNLSLEPSANPGDLIREKYAWKK